MDRANLGYEGDRDPERQGISKKQSGKLIDDLMADVEKHIASKLRPALNEAIARQLGDPAQGKWSLEIDVHDSQTMNFYYPAALASPDYQGVAYITPRVKLEFGARGDPWPTEQKTIRAYSADDFPDFFEDPDCTVTVLSARRTFWEKVTALHAEAHRPEGSPTPQYFSRHYYDVAMLLDTAEGRGAAIDFDMLEQVAKHKAVYFRSGWASYDTALPGTLDLMPAAHRMKDLRADYQAMQAMMFDEKPYTFDEVLARIEALQAATNAAEHG
ncbi:nucleotidyl transferase AbiEii/AbiGii toxin family protein [Mesorhizobium sp. M0991]|uniref:nucleotidyl transferase AbiEii/AbiGii toxin family protein n=1 Tax=Mesorhizobium sp. M0991 TaxID=2957043 RepID=UPI00333BC476